MNILILGSAIILLATTHSINAQQNLTLSFGTIAKYRCWGRSFGMTKNGSPQDCAQAVLHRFPTDIHVGLFHTGQQLDLYHLPVESTYGDCYIELTLAQSGVETEGRWPEVWTLAQTLSTACTYWRNDNPGSGVTGGEIFGGQNNRLKLTMRRSSGVVNNSNETDIAIA